MKSPIESLRSRRQTQLTNQVNELNEKMRRLRDGEYTSDELKGYRERTIHELVLERARETAPLSISMGMGVPPEPIITSPTTRAGYLDEARNHIATLSDDEFSRFYVGRLTMEKSKLEQSLTNIQRQRAQRAEQSSLIQRVKRFGRKS